MTFTKTVKFEAKDPQDVRGGWTVEVSGNVVKVRGSGEVSGMSLNSGMLAGLIEALREAEKLLIGGAA